VDNRIKLEIVSKDGNIVLSKMVEMANFPGESGVFTIMEGHTPFMSTLKYGFIKYKENHENVKYEVCSVMGGFCECKNDEVNVITDAAELVSNLDISRANESKKRAEERLKRNKEEVDFVRAEMSLKRALSRIEANKFYSAQEN
jgi:F-type H+-transporting ATPase subunit epsilon